MTDQTMIERVARALYRRLGSDFDPEQEGEEVKWPEFVDDARAIITAMREPTEAMIEAAVRNTNEPEGLVRAGVWQPMIDAALAEQ